MHTQFTEAGYAVFPLHSIIDGRCGCGSSTCHAAGKHPTTAGWQNTSVGDYHDIDGGYGVLCSGLLVIDVDARNGGLASFDELSRLVPQISGAGLIVETGSGGGSRHLYFKLKPGSKLVSHLSAYPGIDFKHSGFVVGPGSAHVSGRIYNAVVGTPYDIDYAPQALLALLVRKERKPGAPVELIDFAEVRKMLQCVDNTTEGSDPYDKYIQIGMAVHAATDGAGVELWREWAGRSYKGRDTGAVLDKRWNSFKGSGVTPATLLHYARQGGYVAPLTFNPAPGEYQWLTGISAPTVDLDRPPGFVGELAQWIRDQSMYPRESLAVAGALTVVSCLGMRFCDPLDRVTPNVFTFGVAGSATGKESVLKSVATLLKAGGVSAAIYGAIKSEQEIFRNLTRHQGAFYLIDELGEQLAKISNAMKRGGASYLEGVIGALMSVYSKADGFVLITGDLKEEIRKQILQECAKHQRKIDENEDQKGYHQRHLDVGLRILEKLDLGIERPYLSIFGVTTPQKFESLMDYDMAANGFIGRSLIFRELENNPQRKERKGNGAVPLPMELKLKSLYGGCEDRVEYSGALTPIPTEQAAAVELNNVYQEFWQEAEKHESETGLTALPRRCYEHVAKISMILAIPGGVRTIEHVRWAAALVRRDLDVKLRMTHANSADNPTDALASRIMVLVNRDGGETLGRIKNKCRGVSGKEVEETLKKMCDAQMIHFVHSQPEGAGRPTIRFWPGALDIPNDY